MLLSVRLVEPHVRRGGNGRACRMHISPYRPEEKGVARVEGHHDQGLHPFFRWGKIRLPGVRSWPILDGLKGFSQRGRIPGNGRFVSVMRGLSRGKSARIIHILLDLKH